MNLIDKTVRTTVKTTKGLAKSSSTLVRSTAQKGLNITVNFTPDIYDKHEDFGKGTTMFAVGNSVMIGRNVFRAERSLHASVLKGKTNWNKRKIIKKKREIAYNRKKLLEYKKYQTEISKKNSIITKTYLNEQSRKTNNKIVDLQRKTNQLTAKQNYLIRKTGKLKAKEFKPLKSLKATVSNQSRRASAMISHHEDTGTKMVGLSIKGMRIGIRYRRKVTSTVKNAVSLVTSLISGIVTTITSVPAIITAIISFLPFILVFVVIISILSPVISLSFTGRIGTLYGKIDELNSIYEVNIPASEVLAITDVLEWTTPTEEQFEQLYSLMLDQTKGNDLDFDAMATNVFIKYNPSNIYEDSSIYADNMNTHIYYWSLEGFDINFIINNSVKRNMTYQMHIELYPLYKRAGSELKKKLKTEDYQNELIKTAKNKIKINEQRYEDYLFEYHLRDVEFEITEDNEKGVAIAKKALGKLGCDYVWGAGHGTQYKNENLKEFDCSGLVNWSFYQSGINIGDQTTKTLINKGKSIEQSQLQPGDILLFDCENEGRATHVGIYIGNNQMIHAPQPGEKVKIVNITSYYWQKNLVGCKRLY